MKQHAAAHHRKLRPVQKRTHNRVLKAGIEQIDFTANDYLGLSHHPTLIKAMTDAAQQYGTGSTGSRLLSGDYTLTHDVEAEFAEALGKESALLMNSGYQMNVSLIPALVGKGDVVFADKYIHASLIDGIQLSGAKLFRFHHNDTDHLNARLAAHRDQYRKALIVTESVFSMEGDVAPLAEFYKLKTDFDAMLLVDEAHAYGVMGPKGMGRVAATDGQALCDVITGTFGKSGGSTGAFLAVSQPLKDQLINACRGFIYSTAQPLPVVAVNRAALHIIQTMDAARSQLVENYTRVRQYCEAQHLDVRGESPIIPIVIGTNEATIAAQDRCSENGCRVMAVRPPTVPKGQARLRIVITATHTPDDLNALETALCQ